MQQIILFLKGILIGIANVIPGVSGGTMAFILGIYKELTEAVGFYFQNYSKRKSYTILLVTIGLGVIVGIILFARLFTFLLESPASFQITYVFFIGLILGSVPFVLSLHDDMKFNLKRISFAVLAFVLVLMTAYFGQKTGTGQFNEYEILYKAGDVFVLTSLNPIYALWLILCGLLGAIAMILPGFSGSALLVSLGEYYNILYYVDNRMLLQLIVLMIGVLPGLIIAAKVLNRLMEKYPPETYYFILGLIMASVVQVTLTILKSPVIDILTLFLCLVSLAVGLVTSYFMSRVKM